MKVGMYNRWLTTLGGGEKYSLAIAQLLSQNHDVHVISHLPVSQAEMHAPGLIWIYPGVKIGYYPKPQRHRADADDRGIRPFYKCFIYGFHSFHCASQRIGHLFSSCF